MKRHGLIVFGIALAVLVSMLGSTSFAYAQSPDKNSNEYDQWMKDHEMRLHYTKVVKYDGTNIIIEEIYSGGELSRKYGKEELRLTNKFAVPEEVAKKHQLERGVISRTSRTITTAVTTTSDPPEWWTSYDYPQWTWDNVDENPIRKDPINIAWCSGIDKDEVTGELDDVGDPWYEMLHWYNAHEQFIYDPKDGDSDDWEGTRGYATEKYGIWGPRYHVRLYTIYTGNVVGSAHHETKWPHNVTSFETGELRVIDEFDDSCWSEFDNYVEHDWDVHPGSYWLGNFKSEPYNSGYASEIFPE